MLSSQVTPIVHNTGQEVRHLPHHLIKGRLEQCFPRGNLGYSLDLCSSSEIIVSNIVVSLYLTSTKESRALRHEPNSALQSPSFLLTPLVV